MEVQGEVPRWYRGRDEGETGVRQFRSLWLHRNALVRVSGSQVSDWDRRDRLL